MQVRTRRFGSLEVPREQIITMERAILGFEGLREFCLIDVPDLFPFLWLQSIEQESVAFLVVNPAVFFPEYRIEVNSRELSELEVTKSESIETYVIVTLGDEPQNSSVNLQGPILINTDNNLGKQLVLVNSHYQVRHQLIVEQPTTRQSVREELVGV